MNPASFGLAARLWTIAAAFLIGGPGILSTSISGTPAAEAAEPALLAPREPGTSARPAGKVLTLNEAIRLGVAHHPLIEQSRAGLLTAKALTKQTRGNRYPWLEGSVAEASGSLRIVTTDGRIVHDQGGLGFNPGGALPHHNQNMLTGGLILNQLITDFGYTAHRILANEANEAASEKEILTNKAFIVLQVQRAYLHCLLQQSLADIAEKTFTRRKAVSEQVHALYKNQLRSKVDLDLILVEVSGAELALIKARNDLAQAFAALNNAMGIEVPERYELEPLSIHVAPSPDVESLIQTGLNHRPELLGARDRIVVGDELLQAAKALNFGSLSAVGTIGVTKYWDAYDGGVHDDEIAPLWGVGATLKVPIFTGFRIQSQTKEADYRKGESVEELQNLANQVVLQIVRARLTKITNAEQIRLEEDRVAYAREALMLSEQRYRLGLSPILDIVRSTTALFEAESRLAEAQIIYKISEVAVVYAIGQGYQQF
ncbi:MAG TPA: TolC family protein [Nitrospiraceae bacterium]|nr:TolC family protein [Nitrospiraceae bacterium]